LGSVSQDATAGTSSESEADEPPIRFLGDEPELYLEFNDELVKALAARVNASPVDPVLPLPAGRDRAWKGWLIRTGQRQAWKLNAAHHRGGLHIVRDFEDGVGADA
jgi:hypothetical protein